MAVPSYLFVLPSVPRGILADARPWKEERNKQSTIHSNLQLWLQKMVFAAGLTAFIMVSFVGLVVTTPDFYFSRIFYLLVVEQEASCWRAE